MLGIVKNDVAYLSAQGKIVEEEIRHTSIMRREATIDAYVVMPNHVHMIVIIHRVNDERAHAMRPYAEKTFGPQQNNLASIIRGFKSSCTGRIRAQCDETFTWQRSYYDCIIRNEEELEHARWYVRTNSEYWERDPYFAQK